MTTENTASTASAAVEKVNKMAIAKQIYAAVTSNAEITSPRKAFIEQLMSQTTGTTVKCASAYYQMNKTAAAGGKLYKHHSTPKQRAAKAAAAAEPIARPE